MTGCLSGEIVYFFNIISVSLIRLNSMRFGNFYSISFNRLTNRKRGVNGVKIILANKKDWKFFQSGEVDTLGESSLFGCPFAKKNSDYFFFVFHPTSKGCSNSDWK